MTIEIDHMGLSVSDYGRAKAFYVEALKPLNIGVVMEFGDAAGLGPEGKPFLWISGGGKATPPLHLAFRAGNRQQVDEFYSAAMAAGGTDNGPPGLRPHYHQNYYAAFVHDPDGNNIEAVCHASMEDIEAANRPARKRSVKKRAPAKKTAAKRRGAKKPAAKKRAVKKVSARKTATRKPAKKTSARRSAKKPGRGRKTRR